MARLLPVLILLLLLTSGCTTTRQEPLATLPPISSSPTSTLNPGQVIWHDLATSNLKASQTFYGEMFGWTFERLTSGGRRYTAVYNGESLIGGMFEFTAKDRDDPNGEWLINLSSGDVAADATAFAAAGGAILEPAREIPDRGTAAFVRDPQEAILVLTRSSTGDPPDEDMPMGGWLWNELWTHDATAALELYGGIFGYEAESMDGPGGRPYYLLIKEGAPVAGILQIRNPEIRSHWVPFIRVEDLQVSLILAMELGATILIEPDKDIRDGFVALIQSPTGEPIVLQQFDL